MGYAAGELITLPEVDRRIGLFRVLYPEHRALEGPASSLRREFARMLAEEAVLLREAERRGVRVPEEEVEKAARVWWELSRRGEVRVSWEDLRDFARRQMAVNLLQAEVTSRVRVVQEEVYRYYREHPDEFRRPAVARVRLIQTASAAEAGALLARVEGGEDFATLARRHSLHPSTREKGGELGWVWEGEGKLPPEVEEFLWPELLRHGPGRWVVAHRLSRAYLVEVEEYRLPRILDYREVEMELQLRLVGERREEFWQRFRESLLRRHRVIWFWWGE